MSDIVVVIRKDGNIAVDINLPEGEECHEADVTLRATLALLGIADPSILDDVERVPVPDGTRNKQRG